MADPIDFSQRADLDECMDGPCSYEDLRACLRDLAVVNRLTRAHRPILRWLERLMDARLTSHERDVERPHPLRIVDFGCGYGDMLRRIEGWAARRGTAVELIGVDVNANAIRAAREATPASSRIVWFNGDVALCAEAAGADVFTVSGVMHHLTEAEIVRLIAWMEQTARVGWFIADLHRMRLPYRVFDLAMCGPWWHPYIRPDGLASIRRSFLAQDWRRMCAAAGLEAEDVQICEHRPARLCVERTKWPFAG
jgi:SAM-dependent methyltransferase